MRATHVRAKHLCVCVHGIRGQPDDFNFLARQLRTDPDVQVLQSAASSTLVSPDATDGIDFIGDRVAEEIKEVAERIDARRISKGTLPM